ncbi:MAG TPA: PEGA domain-containing protein, partial [Myxococcaceae bacterium]|nr:PEGA domain-containing protein [Myxococcaceae bacterium]
MGRPVTPQQIVQFIAQVSPNTDSALPAPLPGTPRNGLKPAPTPVHTPAPMALEPSGLAEPVLEPLIIERTEPLPSPVSKPSSTTTVPFTQPGATLLQANPPAARGKKWFSAAVGTSLLLVVGGYMLFSAQAASEPVKPPLQVASVEATPAQPAQTSPASKPAESESSSVPSTPPQDPPTPVENPSTPEQGKPPAVAELTPTPVEPRSSPPPKPRPLREKKPKSTAPPKQLSAAPVVGTGKFIFRVSPFGVVIVNGNNLGQTPLAPAEFPAGTYQIQIINEQLKKNETQVYELKPGEEKIIKVKFGN